MPCVPRLQFINAFRCAVGFQTAAYNEAVRMLLHDDALPAGARVGFWDVSVPRRADETNHDPCPRPRVPSIKYAHAE